jgi:hypothetical protein
MTLHPWVAYALAIVMIVLALLVGRRGHSVRARNVRSSVVAGEVNESVTITSTETHAANGQDRGNRHGDRIAWVIAIVGVLVAAAQFAHDAFGFLK